MVFEVAHDQRLQQLADAGLSISLAIVEDDCSLEVVRRHCSEHDQNAPDPLVNSSLQLSLGRCVALIDALSPSRNPFLVAPNRARAFNRALDLGGPVVEHLVHVAKDVSTMPALPRFRIGGPGAALF